MIIAFITFCEDFQANPADMLPALALNVIAPIYLLNYLPTSKTALDLFFPFTPLLQR
jgi:hypothetical protein